MSAGDQAAAALAAQLAFAGDGAFLGLALAYVAFRSFSKFVTSSSALRKIKDAPTVQVSDLRTLINEETTTATTTTTTTGGVDGGADGGERNSEVLVVVRGTVESKSTVNGSWKSLWPDVLVSHDTGDRAVIIQRSQKYIYNEWRGLLGWYPDVRSILARAWRVQGSTSVRTVPFVLVDGPQKAQSDYVVVELDGSRHPLPLTTVYRHMQPIQASPYTFLQALCGYEYPVGLLDEENILPVGKEVTALGTCSSNNGVLEMKPCSNLPYFLSELSKDQIIIELSLKTKILLWSGIAAGSLSLGILGFAIYRNWGKWKHWWARRRAPQYNQGEHASIVEVQEEEEVIEEEEMGDIPDGQLCVICLMRRRRSAFVPCGHLVCCQRCAFSVERDLAPKCPVCRQPIRGSVRIYDT